MPSSQSTAARPLGVLSALLAVWPTLTAGLTADYCADFNTATGGTKTIANLMSNGYCRTFCAPKNFAFAITQDKTCWCSNYAPALSDRKAISQCDLPCPGYPFETCGSNDGSLLSYIILDVQPSGTKDGSQSTTTTSPSSSSLSKTTSSHSSSSSTNTKSSTTEPPPSTSVGTTTGPSGSIITVTVVTQPTGSASNEHDGTTHKSGLSTGALVGIVVGVILGVIAVVGVALFFFFRKRRRSKQDAFQNDPSIRGSSSGMARPEMTTSGGSAHSAGGSAGNRNSALAIDPRMDPFKQGLYARSASHESVNTIRDEHDYSRRIQAPKVLRATNPDPEGE